MTKYPNFKRNLSEIRPPIRIDGHAHIFARNLPMLKDRRYTPSRNATLATYRTLQDTAGFSGGILVQPSFLGTDNRYLTNALRNGQDSKQPRFWGVCVLPPTTSRRQIVALSNYGFIGTRLNLIGRHIPNLNTAVWQRFLSLINEVGWHLEICIEGRRLADILPSALSCCRRVVVDHFGLPNPSAPFKCPGWRAIMSVTSGQLWIKASAPYRVFPNIPPNESAERCNELARLLCEHIGLCRIIWGSDWPWTQNESAITYETTIKWRSQWLSGHDEDGAANLLSLCVASPDNYSD